MANTDNIDSIDNIDNKAHEGMMIQLLPFVEYLQAHGYGYWISIGREGVGTNYCGGSRKDVLGVTTELISRNPEIASLLQQALIEQLD